MGGKVVAVDSFNILDLFGEEHSEDAQAEAMVEFGQRLGHDRNCESALDSRHAYPFYVEAISRFRAA